MNNIIISKAREHLRLTLSLVNDQVVALLGDTKRGKQLEVRSANTAKAVESKWDYTAKMLLSDNQLLLCVETMQEAQEWSETAKAILEEVGKEAVKRGLLVRIDDVKGEFVCLDQPTVVTTIEQRTSSGFNCIAHGFVRFQRRGTLVKPVLPKPKVEPMPFHSSRGYGEGDSGNETGPLESTKTVDIEVCSTSAASPWFYFQPLTEKGKEVLGPGTIHRCREDYVDSCISTYRSKGAVVEYKQ